jgi:glycosyltransferase involved in cell wall biosynthesis
MKVLLTVHQFFPKYQSGTEVLTRDTGLEMLKRGHEVHVLTTDPSADGRSTSLRHKDYDYRGLKVRALELQKRESAWEIFRNEYRNGPVADHVRRYVDHLKPEVVHMFHVLYLSGSVIEVFRQLGVPLVYTPTDFWSICVKGTLRKPSGELSTGPDELSANCLECRTVERNLPPYKAPEAFERREFYRKIAERALTKREDEHQNMAAVREVMARTSYLRERFNSIDAILVPTKFMHNMLAKNGINPGLMTFSPYGMDTSHLRNANPPQPGRGGLRVGYIGSIKPWKGLRVLLEAFEKLPADDGVTLRVCGDLGDNPSYAREVYELAKDDPRINFAGTFPNEKLAEELGKIDVLVVPSVWYENTPLVIYSAFAAGVPVVATNLGGIAEIVRHEVNGLLFEPGDAEDLARQLERLLRESGLTAELGDKAGRVRSAEDSVDEMLALYERLLRLPVSQHRG